MLVVIDTNIFVVCLTSRSPWHSIFTKLVAGQFEIAVTNEILLEYLEIISEKYSERTAHEFLNLLIELPNVKFIDTYYRWQLIPSDKDDNKFVDCAIAASAEYIVTEDNHFNILSTVSFPKVGVLGLESFINLIDEPSS